MNDREFLSGAGRQEFENCLHGDVPARIRKYHAPMRGIQLAPIQYLNPESIR